MQGFPFEVYKKESQHMEGKQKNCNKAGRDKLTFAGPHSRKQQLDSNTRFFLQQWMT
jgi:hypothetical protein